MQSMLKIQLMENFMEKYYSVLMKCPLFNDIAEEELCAMLDCLGAKVKKYFREQGVISEGDEAKYLGIVLTGEVQISRIDIFGNRTIIAKVYPSQLFGEAFACAEMNAIPISVVASRDCEVMLIDAKRITQSCTNACFFHSKLIFNLLKVVAKKNILFHEKIEVTSKRTTQEKLMAYLLIQAKKTGSSTFTIPFDRQELADYLEVDRSGLSSEISKMRKKGIIESRRNLFKILSHYGG